MSLILAALAIYVEWRIYEKLGLEGWKSLIPFYGEYVLFERVYDDGWRFLLLLIPFYGIYIQVKLMVDLTRNFGKAPTYAIGMVFIPLVFKAILAFSGDVQYKEIEDSEEYVHALRVLTAVSITLGILSLCLAFAGSYIMYTQGVQYNYPNVYHYSYTIK